ncbi:MAG TPA: glycosyltransferase [Thermoplasmata archaeon]|nr:glycosyltransferase [Thermoplasmata archaeon]
MGSSPPPRPLVSVVITVRNEGPHIRRLFESLLVQEPPFEVVLVDALSHDETYSIAQEYARKFPDRIRVFQRFGSRGIGRNAGASASRGEYLAFTDGDCVADSQWLTRLRAAVAETGVAAGRVVPFGKSQYAALDRVELFLKGSDVTHPSCNLAYRRELFEQLNGFDPRFITAEDIDLNLRAVQRGASIREVPEAVVYHEMRTTFIRFLIQAFWNGYGRKQLTEKHGTLWGNYRIRRLLQTQRTVIAWARLTAAMAGYLVRVMTGGERRLSAEPATGGGPA